MEHNKDNKLPIKMFLSKVKNIPAHLHKSMEIIFVLKGELHVTVNNQPYKLVESDIILINSEDIHEIEEEEENLVLTMEIESDFYTEIVKKEQMVFLCNSSLYENKNYNSIREILSKIMYEYSNQQFGYEYKIMSLTYQLIYILNVNFYITDLQQSKLQNIKNGKHSERINNILIYIKQNYEQTISLKNVADSQYLTPEYFSKFFKSQMGMTFSKYLNEIRLSQAVKELINTDNTVTKIAMNNGFPNSVAFHKVFKEEYNTTPAQYRSKIRTKLIKNIKIEKIHSEITKVDYNQVAEKLAKYLYTEKSIDIENKQFDPSNSVDVNVNSQNMVSHSWKQLINLGYAMDGLRSDLQQHLTVIQKNIKFEYARFQNIFSDEMLTISEQKDDDITYNFSKINKLIDFLYSIGLKPFIELGNKPKILSGASISSTYYKHFSDKERNIEEWKDLLQKFIIHCVNRYGINEVSDWYFEIWKEGENDLVFWNGSFEKYMDIYSNFYQVIKEIVPKAKVGGPGLNCEINLEWLKELLAQWEKRGNSPDFLSLYLYPYELVVDSKNKRINPGTHSFRSNDKNYLKANLDKVKKILNKSDIGTKEVFVTEWNSSISHRDPSNDTIFKAAYIVKNIIDNLDGAESFGYWLSSDISGEFKDSKNLLYGDMGLINADGIKKPGFYAYEMLAKLGNKLIQKGNGYIVTSKSPYNYEIITYNYKHFDYYYCLNEEISLNLEQYYTIFENQLDLNLSINLKGVKNGNYRIKKYTLNRNHGSVFDEWLKMNAIQNIKQEEIDYLKQICTPKQTVWYAKTIDELKIDSVLSPHEVNLYEIIFNYN